MEAICSFETSDCLRTRWLYSPEKCSALKNLKSNITWSVVTRFAVWFPWWKVVLGIVKACNWNYIVRITLFFFYGTTARCRVLASLFKPLLSSLSWAVLFHSLPNVVFCSAEVSEARFQVPRHLYSYFLRWEVVSLSPNPQPGGQGYLF
jgi:hypothetical protein